MNEPRVSEIPPDVDEAFSEIPPDVGADNPSSNGTAQGADAFADLKDLNALLTSIASQWVRWTTLFERLEKWESDGTLVHLDRTLHFLSAAVDSLTPEIVSTFVQTAAKGLEGADVALHSQIGKVGPGLFAEMEESLREPIRPQKHELRHLLKVLQDPEVQDGLDVLLRIVKGLGREHARLHAHAKSSEMEAVQNG